MKRASGSGWLIVVVVAVVARPAAAERRYGPGASDSEIKIGNIAPYTGPASVWSVMAKTVDAYFAKVNAEGGVAGRKVRFISYDDALNPAKTVEQARRLVEIDEVLFLFQNVGASTAEAIRGYVNARKVPLLFVAAATRQVGDPKRSPWTMGLGPTCYLEGWVLAGYLLETRPQARIGVVVPNHDMELECVQGMRDRLGDKATAMIVSEQRYELADPTIDSQLVNLRAAGVDVVYDVAWPKHVGQAIRRLHDMSWHPLHLVNYGAGSIASVLKPAGVEAATGVVAIGYLKDPTDPRWKDDPGVRAWREFRDRYLSSGDRSSHENYATFGYTAAQLVVEVLKRCGDDLTRANVMRQATSLKGVELPMLLPGITIDTAPDDYLPIEQVEIRRFDGERYQPLGPIVTVRGHR